MDRKLISIAIIFIIVLALSSCSQYQQTKVQKGTGAPIDGQQQGAKPNLLVPEEPTREPDNGAGGEPSVPDEGIQEDTSLKKINITKEGASEKLINLKKGMTLMLKNIDLEQPYHLLLFWNEDKSIRFSSGNLDYEQSFSYTFNISGVYTFVDISLEDEDKREISEAKIVVS